MSGGVLSDGSYRVSGVFQFNAWLVDFRSFLRYFYMYRSIFVT